MNRKHLGSKLDDFLAKDGILEECRAGALKFKKVETACRAFDAGKLTIGHAARLARMSEVEFERQLERRGIPRYRYTEEKLDQDIETLKKLGRW